jgi:Periplasmic protein TonB, links inner and outer membranes
MKRLLLLLLLCGLLADTALANRATEVEASTLVTGTIVVAPDGHVQSYAVDHPDKVAPGVLAMIDKSVPTWTFQPVLVEGKPVAAKAVMSLRLVARKADNGDYTVRISGASFGYGLSNGQLTYKNRKLQPNYPFELVRAGVGGTVYLVLKIDSQGRVVNAAAEQVDLTVKGDNVQMRRWREILGRSALEAIAKWTFNTPTSGQSAAANYWFARVPVSYSLHRMDGPDDTPRYGQWHAYVPGPRELIPWLNPPWWRLAARTRCRKTASSHWMPASSWRPR